MMQKNLLKKVAPIVLSAAMLLGMTSVAFAKSSKGVVQNVTIDLDYDLSPGMTASQIDAESDSAGVDSVKVTSITNTDFGKKPKVTLKLKPDSDFTFKGTPKGNVKLNDKGGKGAEVSKIVTSASAMTVTLTLPKTGSTDKDALEVGDVSWGDDDSPVVSWDQADYAKQYEVKLYRNNTIRESVTTNRATGPSRMSSASMTISSQHSAARRTTAAPTTAVRPARTDRTPATRAHG